MKCWMTSLYNQELWALRNVPTLLKNKEMKEILKEKLGLLSASDFGKVKQIYSITNGIKGSTIEEFVSNVPEDTVQGVINLCNKQLGL